jgi:hypothetical protein
MITLKEIVNVVGKPHLENLKIQVRQDIAALQHCSYTFVRIQKQSKARRYSQPFGLQLQPSHPSSTSSVFSGFDHCFFP